MDKMCTLTIFVMISIVHDSYLGKIIHDIDIIVTYLNAFGKKIRHQLILNLVFVCFVWKV